MFLHGLGATSIAQFLDVATSPAFAGRRALLVDLLGFGHSDRPADCDYSLVSHGRAVAAVLEQEGLRDIDLVGHSLGGSIAIVLAHSRPDLVGRLVAIEPNLVPWDGTASVAIARQTEDDFVAHGFDALVAVAGDEWAATLRLADRRATYRTAVGLCEGTTPTMRDMLAMASTLQRTLIWGELSPPPPHLDELLESGVVYDVVSGSGHVPMSDNPVGFLTAVAAALSH